LYGLCLLSYCGAQIFEIYGLGQDVVDLAFCGSVSKIGGLTLDEVNLEFNTISTNSSYCLYAIIENLDFDSSIFFSLILKYSMLTRLLFIMKLGRETLSFWVKAFSEDTAKRLENFGFIQFRPGGKLGNDVYVSPWSFFFSFSVFFPCMQD
jgi:glutamate synthase (ferredoxin)